MCCEWSKSNKQILIQTLNRVEFVKLRTEKNSRNIWEAVSLLSGSFMRSQSSRSDSDRDRSN